MEYHRFAPPPAHHSYNAPRDTNVTLHAQLMIEKIGHCSLICIVPGTKKRKMKIKLEMKKVLNHNAKRKKKVRETHKTEQGASNVSR